MPFELQTAHPIQEDEEQGQKIDTGFDLSSSREISPEESPAPLDNTEKAMEIFKSTVRAFETVPVAAGKGMFFAGKELERHAKTTVATPTPLGVLHLSIKGTKIGNRIDDFMGRFGSDLAAWGKNTSDFYSESASKGWEAPNPAVAMGWRYPFLKIGTLAIESAPMTAIAFGVTALTKNPAAGAAVMFPAAAGDMYMDALNNGVEPEKAANLAVTTGISQVALERIPLAGWMKGGSLLKRVIKTSIQEGLIEEGSQQILDNSLRVIGWKDSRPIIDRLTDGLAESIAAGMVTGGALGSFQPPSFEDIRFDIHQNVIKDGLKQGLNEDQISETLSAMDDMIFKVGEPPGIKPEEKVSREEPIETALKMTPEELRKKFEAEAPEYQDIPDPVLRSALHKSESLKSYIPALEYAKRSGNIERVKIFEEHIAALQLTGEESLVMVNYSEGQKTEPPKTAFEQEDKVQPDMPQEGIPEFTGNDSGKYPADEYGKQIAGDEVKIKELEDHVIQMAEAKTDAMNKMNEAPAGSPEEKIFGQKIADLAVQTNLTNDALRVAKGTLRAGDIGTEAKILKKMEGQEPLASGGPSGGKIGQTPKQIPPTTATGKMAFEESEPWRVNLGKDIEGLFEREIGPKLQVTKRFKKWLGAYYSWLGPSGTIRTISLANETTLFHETGHFLDDALGGFEISRQKAVRAEFKAVSMFIRPWDPSTASKSFKAYRNSKVELFADYVAAYGLNPDKARELAPNFTAKVDELMTKDNEWSYVISKLREFEELMKPMKEYVNALRKIPEFNLSIQEWAEKGNLLQQLWRSQIGDKIWKAFSDGLENTGNKLKLKSFFERGGLNQSIFEVLRQRRKLISGQQERLKENLITPISKLGEEDQQFIAESLQRFKVLPSESELNRLTEEARKELALWGNEARKLGLLGDGIFWNNIGQYFPFFYETKEFEKNKRKFGYFPSKAIRANFSALKHKMTDEEFGRKVLESMWGTWPKQKAKINAVPKAELENIGRNAREELGLIKTAAYPLQKRLFQMIEMTYTVKAFNQIARMPGIVGSKNTPGFEKMPEGKKYGDLSGQYVPESLVREVSKWSNVVSDLGKVWMATNRIWKGFKVAWNPAASVRNSVTNSIMEWMADVPVHDLKLQMKAITAFRTKNDTYKLLRDHGLYHNTYSEQEILALAFQVKENPENIQEGVTLWAQKLYGALETPAKFYGAVEDIHKTIMAQYVLDQGGTPEQAVKFADKWLFDYSQTSEAVGYARQFLFPFATWSAKVLPRMFEVAIRKPEKIALIVAMAYIFSGLSRAMLGVKDDEEEEVKPEYLKGKLTLLMPIRDQNEDLNWMDLTYFLPWGSWLPVNKGNIAPPSAFTMGNPLMSFYNAYVLNYDPFVGEIAPDYLTEDDKQSARNAYLLKSLGPNILTMTPTKLLNSGKPDKYRREQDLSKIIAGDILGMRLTADTSAYQKQIIGAKRRMFSEGRSKIIQQLRRGEIKEEQAKEKIEKLFKEKFPQKEGE